MEPVEELAPQHELDKTDMALLQELLKSRYFEVNVERPTQLQIASRMGLSAGTVNRWIRNLESLAFSNLLSLKPDLAKFRSIYDEIEAGEEKK